MKFGRLKANEYFGATSAFNVIIHICFSLEGKDIQKVNGLVATGDT